MKKVIVFALVVFMVSTSIKAQVTAFKFEIGGLYGLPTDKDLYKGGVGFYAHPSYYLGDQINIGIKAESVIIGGASKLGTSVSISAIGSYLVTSNYYFTVSKVRPYVGLGVGMYTLGSATVSADPNNSSEPVVFGDKFGVAPKIGLDLGHFTLNFSYNLIFGLEGDNDKNYMTAGIGVFFGGGVKGKGGKKSNKNRIISIEDDE